MDRGKKGSAGPKGRQSQAPAQATEEQKQIAREIFSQYDLSKLSTEDAKAIFRALGAAGFRGTTLRAVLGEAGIDVDAFRTMTLEGKELPKKGQGQRPSPREGERPPVAVLTEEQKQAVREILGQYDLHNLDTESARAIYHALGQAGIRGQAMRIALDQAGVDTHAFRELTLDGKAPPKRAAGGKRSRP